MAATAKNYLAQLTELSKDFENGVVSKSALMFSSKLDTAFVPEQLANDILQLSVNLNNVKMHIVELQSSLNSHLEKYQNKYPPPIINIPIQTYPNTYPNAVPVSGGSRKRKTHRKSHNKKHRTHKR